MWVNNWLLSLCIVLPITLGLLTPLEDPNASDKYSISYVTPEYWQTAIRDNASALAEGYTLEIGDGLSCYVRQQGSNDTSNAKRQKDELEFDKLSEDNLQRGVDIILDDIKECITFMSGYWTYRYCPKSGLSQFHGNPLTTPLYYVLGRPKETDQEREFQLLYNNFDYYISEIVESGDICDITGSPRVVEIQYVCGAAADSATIQWIKEVKTCYYEVQIAVPKLCELELLSSSEEKKASNPVLCVDQKLPTGTVDLLGKYEPIFMGSNFYILEPQIGSTADQRKILLYSGQHNVKDGFVESDAELYENIGSAFSRILYQQLLVPPGEPAYKPGDEISWISDVVDLHGNYLTRLQFNLSSTSLADISLSSTIEFPESGNLLYHRQGTAKDTSDKKFKHSHSDSRAKKMGSSRGTDKDVKLLVMDSIDGVPQFLDVSDAEDLFENILSLEQLEAVLKEQGVLGEFDTLEDIVKDVVTIDEQGGEAQYALGTLLDELRQAGTTEVHNQKPELKAFEGSEEVGSEVSYVPHDSGLQDDRQEDLAANFRSKEDREIQDEVRQEEEQESQNEFHDTGNHFHDEL
ncbi:hypothetical protein ZYGR_0AZ00780 [Zygosaccharomyces rouxii]|uniref:Endoplasmic reticulum lectin n=1 Tax=Zygosaccharomyces rouxii TaxID=4956 RepID=A0A1Q3AJJ4_ZYGRO|nr:hypothetical protein ZYGR_0AZ00780 [Zygosaccharomyces rouxii]